MDPRESGRRRSLLGEDSQEKAHTIGMIIGAVIIFGYPALILIAKFAALFGIHE